MKPDQISEMEMARTRMASAGQSSTPAPKSSTDLRAVEPPPQYFSDDDQCHVQHTAVGYSKQVMPSRFEAHDRPEMPTDDTMILLDVSGSMDFEPVRCVCLPSLHRR
jgi:hypothetical protein